MSGQDRIGLDRTRKKRKGKDRTGQDRSGQERTGQDKTVYDRASKVRAVQSPPQQQEKNINPLKLSFLDYKSREYMNIRKAHINGERKTGKTYD